PASVESLVLESILGRADGSFLPVEISSRWCQIEQGCELISIVHDITEREERRQRLVRLNHLYRALSQLNESSARTPTPAWLAAETCRLCAEEGGFTLAWVGWLAGDGLQFSVEVQDGEFASMDHIHAPLDLVPLHGTATAPPQIWKKLPLTFSAARMSELNWPWTERERAGLKTMVTLPLHRSGQSDGLLVIGDSKREGFSAEEIALLEEFAKGISLSHELEARNQARQAAEAALRSSENRLGFLLSATPVIIFTCRPDGDHALTFVSANVEASLGRSASSLLDRPGVWSDLVAGEDCDDLLTGLSFLGPGAPLVQEIRFRHPTLLFVWMRMEVKLVLDGDGQPRECVGFLLDVTERRTAERLLREREEQFSAIVSQAADAIVLVDLSNGRFIEFNQVAHESLGYTREEFEQLTVPDIEAEHNAAMIRENLDRIRQGEAVAFDTLHRTKTGGLRSVRVSARGLTLRGLSCATAVWVDLTERRKAEILLRESRDRLSKAEQMARLGNWDLDLVSNRLTWSDEIYRIFEVDPLKFDATYSRFIERIHPEDRERVDRAFRESVEQHSRYVVAHRLIMPDGRIKYVEESGETLYDAEGRPVRSIGTVQDVTAGKLAELELQGLVRELRALHAISQIVEHRETALPVLLQQVVDQLPDATRHPSGVLARIRLEEREVSAGAAGLAQDAMSVMISVDGRPAGSITVGYVTPFSIARDGPIFVQEREMLESVARTVGLALGERESFELTRRSEERFRALFDHAEVGMFETTPAGWITRANRFLGDLIGVPPSALVGKHWSSFVAAVGDLQSPPPPPTPPRKRRCIRKDTREFWGLLTSRIEHDATGRAVGHICVLQDISEQISARETLLRFNADLEEKVKQRTAELAASHRELQALLLAVPDLVMRLRTDGTVLYSQRAREASVLNGLADNEGRPAPAFPREALLQASIELGRRALAENAIATGETALDAGGESRSIELRAAPIGMEEFVVFGRDITDRKRMEAKTAAMLERERQVSEMKSRFISVTSHEFRTPMAAAVGSVELLANHHDRLSPAKRSELYGRVTLSLRRMTDMLDDLLTLNRMEARHTQVSWERIDVARLVHDVVDEIRLGDRDAHEFDTAVTGPVVSFTTDPNLLRHILSNLLSNAVRYSPAGTRVTVRVSGEAERLMLSVEDQGIGIPAGDRNRIFEPFERGSNVGVIKGTGLGLNIVRRMTELMGGTITIDPDTTQGSRFLLSFPQSASLPAVP
ncbi:MAG TPA: PAS domain S-box protein, partial [Opitutaceae bacterium]|nr:PAS domain S-box protein [Opitutaceae bacterium]